MNCQERARGPSTWSSSFTLLSQSKKPGTKTIFFRNENKNNWWWTRGRVVRGERCQKLAHNWETASTNNSNNCSLWQQYRLFWHCSVLVNKRIKRFNEIFHPFLVLGSWLVLNLLITNSLHCKFFLEKVIDGAMPRMLLVLLWQFSVEMSNKENAGTTPIQARFKVSEQRT